MQKFEIELPSHLTRVSFTEAPIKKIIVSIRKGFNHLTELVMNLVSILRKGAIKIRACLKKTVHQIKAAQKSIPTSFTRLVFLFKRRVILEDDRRHLELKADSEIHRRHSMAAEAIIQKEYFVVNINNLDGISKNTLSRCKPNTVVRAGPHLASRTATKWLNEHTSHEADSTARGIDAHGKLVL
ncbi:MAG: hypothetical protein S4CHLAM20_12660 [Chlamydiia bacterium]|nr:hypothetical protein [Chlamydiia bacterium]